jgi:hypothetical protein
LVYSCVLNSDLVTYLTYAIQALFVTVGALVGLGVLIGLSVLWRRL